MALAVIDLGPAVLGLEALAADEPAHVAGETDDLGLVGDQFSLFSRLVVEIEFQELLPDKLDSLVF